MAPSSGRFQRQASLDAALRYSPQRSVLREALLEAQRNYGSTVRAGNSLASLTEQRAKAAKPEVAAIYSQADAAQRPGATLVSQALANLPGVADQFKADSANEVQQQLANLISARASAETALHQRGVAARAGAQFNQNQARSTLAQAVQNLFSKQSGIAGEEGAFKASELDKLTSEAEQQAQKRAESQEGNQQQERASERSANTSRENAKEAAAAKRAAGGSGYVGGVKQLTTKEQNEGAHEYNAIRGLAQAAFREGHSRQQVLHLLTEEEPSISHSVSERDKNGKPTGKSQSINIPARKAYAPTALMAAALDTAQFGGVTKATVGRLHAEGYSVKALGLRIISTRSAQVQKGVGSAVRGAVNALKV